MKKKLFAWITSLVLLFSLPISVHSAYADDGSQIATPTSTRGIGTISAANRVDTLEECNIISKDLISGTLMYIDFDPSVTQSLSSSLYSVGNQDAVLTAEEYNPETANIVDGTLNSGGEIALPAGVIGEDTRTPIENTTAWPYRSICHIVMYYNYVLNQKTKQYENIQRVATGFLEGPNLLVTAGHCVYKDVTSTSNDGDTTYDDKIINPRFPNAIEVSPGVYNTGTDKTTVVKPYGYCYVNKIFIQKEYYTNQPEIEKFDYDWAACLLNYSFGYDLGWNGKSANDTFSNENVTIIGYPGDLNYRTMYEATGQITSTSTYRYYNNVDVNHGVSGAPMFITKNGKTYVCGILTGGQDTINWGTRFNTFIFRFLNNLLPAVTIENMYVEEGQETDYNCLVRVIWDIPPDAARILVSQDGGLSYSNQKTTKTVEFYSSTSTSRVMNCPYTHVRAMDSNGNMSNALVLAECYTEGERSPLYKTHGSTAFKFPISTEFNAYTTTWEHNGVATDEIKGTIACNGEAKNIEGTVPASGASVTSVSVGGFTFYMQCTPTTVSIRANAAVSASENAKFAFAVV